MPFRSTNFITLHGLMHTGYMYALLGIECTHCVPCTALYLSQWAEGENLVSACLDKMTVEIDKNLLRLD